jgi:hypothetical protein
MIDEYCIISVDDSRKDNKDYIRACMPNEVNISCVDGRTPSELLKAKIKWNKVDTPGPYKAGEFGIFYSVLNCLEYGATNNGIVYFEDDAVPVPDIYDKLQILWKEMPRNMDMFALWYPENQQHDYRNVSGYNNVGEPQYGAGGSESIFNFGHSKLCYLWQGYGNVSMAFSKAGCKKLLKYIQQKGFFSPIDCLICIAVHGGYLQGYGLIPGQEKLINYDWDRPTTIHKSRWGYINDLTEEQ